MKSWKQKTAVILAAFALAALAFQGISRAARQGDEKKPEGRKDSQKASNEPTRPIPPYFKSVKAAQPLAHVLPASRFAGRPVVVRAYEIAAKIPKVLAQEPCYCGCDKHFGHHSLLDCYASDHTAGCAVCVEEAFLAYELHQEGKTPAQIRAAIERGDWKKIDINHPPGLRP